MSISNSNVNQTATEPLSRPSAQRTLSSTRVPVSAKNPRPQNQVERRVAQLVSELMGGLYIRRDENFFRLNGGNCMFAAKLLVGIRQGFQVDLSLRQLFDSPTIASLAKFITNKLPTKAD